MDKIQKCFYKELRNFNYGAQNTIDTACVIRTHNRREIDLRRRLIRPLLEDWLRRGGAHTGAAELRLAVRGTLRARLRRKTRTHGQERGD